MSLRVHYSILVPIASSGNGLIAGVEVAEAARQGVLEAAYSTGSRLQGIPLHRVAVHHVPFVGRFPWGKRLNWNLTARQFDGGVASRLTEGDLFHGWALLSLASIRRAMELGMTTVIERGSIHAADWAELVDEEYGRIGLEGRHFLCHPEMIRRSVDEYQAVDVILSPSRYVTESFRARGLGRKVCTLPLGVDVELFRPVSTVVDRDDPFTILYFGMIDPRKGVHDLLDAVAALGRARLRLRLIGHANSRYLELLKRKGVPFEHVPHLPHRALRDQVAAAGACVFPSIEDGFAMVVAEAMASGTPVIVSENTGAKDLLVGGRGGVVVPIRSPDRIAHHLAAWLRDPEGAHHVGLAGRAAVVDRSWRAYGEDLVDLWRRVRSGERELHLLDAQGPMREA